jgi:hypothetical protein
MAGYRITNVNRNNSREATEKILLVSLKGSNKRYSQLQIADWIDLGEHEFFMELNGKTYTVTTAVSPKGNKYIKTQNDGSAIDYLLRLPECK